MASAPHLSASAPHLSAPAPAPTSARDVFDDEFAEASIEAISFAAMRNVSNSMSSNPPRPTDEHSFPRPPPSLPSRSHVLRRALSTLSSHSVSRSRSSARFSVAPPAPPAPPPTVALRFDVPPNLAPVPYPDAWYTDVLLLPHNALRAELADLCAMLASLASPAPHILPRMRAVADWWPPFDAFLSDYFAFENNVLIPWIYRGPAAHDLHDLRQKMAGHAAYIHDLVLEVHNVLALFKANPETDVLPLLIRTAGEFIPSLLQYLDVEERYLPPVIHAGHTDGDAFNLTRLMTRELDAILLTRWISKRKERTAIRRMYMSPTACVKYFARRRKAYVSHLELVDVVCTTLAIR